MPELRVVNRAGKMVLILDGEELVGAKQNRIVNTTILVAAGCEIVIPVSCVEQGRWTYKSDVFSSKQRVMSPSIRQVKARDVNASLRSTGLYRSDQSAIWQEVAGLASRRGAVSESMDMDHVFDKEAPVIKEYLEGFALVNRQVGAVFLVRQVQDVSLSQLSNQGQTSDWICYDLDIQDHHLVDVKNSRRSKNSRERYTEHCVPKFKRSPKSGEHVFIAGILSEYLWPSYLLNGEFSDKDILYLGELDCRKPALLRDQFQDENFILDFGDGPGPKQFFPPWVFDFPEFTYPQRKRYAEGIMNEGAFDHSVWKTAGYSPLPVFLANGLDLSGRWGQDQLADWEWQFYRELLSLPEDHRFSLPFVFLAILKNFILNVVSGVDTPSYRPDGYRKFIYFDEGKLSATAPLFIFDPLKTVDELITSLSTLWRGDHRLIKTFKKFKLVN